jgi:hypothetical protein
MHATLEGTTMTQHTIKRGLKLFGKAGTHAVLQELKQLHDRKVVQPKTFHDMPLQHTQHAKKAKRTNQSHVVVRRTKTATNLSVSYFGAYVCTENVRVERLHRAALIMFLSHFFIQLIRGY